MTASTTMPTAPNHHADHPGMHGIAGVLAGLTMALGGGQRARLAVALAALRPDDHVIDVGCGPGRAARAAARPGATVVGIDPAPTMLRMARAWPGRGRGRVTWRRGTAEALPVADGAASVVWSIATVHHWRDVDAGLAEVRRVLRAGGRLVVIERWRPPSAATGLASHGWTDDQTIAFADACVAAGLADVEHERHGPLVAVVAR
jgi:ubiquinone/menaquinone biosynthesis C-methylase UbiE